MEQTFTTHSASQTAALGVRLGQAIQKPTTIAFFGGMGSGKTCFTAGLCKGLGYEGDVTSPTFALVNEYFGGRFPIFHFDMYRILDEEDLYGIGYYDYLEENGICVIEWSENIADALPPDCIRIVFSSPAESQRNITIHSDILGKE